MVDYCRSAAFFSWRWLPWWVGRENGFRGGDEWTGMQLIGLTMHGQLQRRGAWVQGYKAMREQAHSPLEKVGLL